MSNTQINPYRIAPSYRAVASGLLASLNHWWSYNDNLNDSIGTAHMAPYATAPTYQAGLKGKEAKLGSAIFTGLTLAFSTTDRAFFGWINVVGAAAGNRALFGLSDVTLGVGGYRQYISVASSGSAITCSVNDNATVKTVSGTSTVGQRHFVVMNVDKAALTADLYIGGVFIGTTAVSTSIINCGYFGVHANSPSDADGTTDYVDEIGFVATRKLTATEIAYLATGKSYADVVADAAP